MNKLAKMALTLAAAGSVATYSKTRSRQRKAYQTVENNDTVKKAKATATDTYHKVKDSETVKKIKDSETYHKVKDSETVQKAKDTIKDTYNKVKDSETIQKAKNTVSDTYDKLKDKVKEKAASTEDGDREYFTLHEDTTGAEETTSEEAATEDVVTPEATADIPDETTAKAVTETVAEAEDVLAEATGAVANAAAAETSAVIGDEVAWDFQMYLRIHQCSPIGTSLTYSLHSTIGKTKTVCAIRLITEPHILFYFFPESLRYDNASSMAASVLKSCSYVTPSTSTMSSLYIFLSAGPIFADVLSFLNVSMVLSSTTSVCQVP